jgi:signal transduction histidine kinase
MLVFWWLMRRRMQIREVELNARIDAERRLSVAKDEFIAGLSHELRTPLTTIHGFSEVLMGEPGLGSDVEEMLSIVNQSSSELTRMVNDLITAARIDDGSLTWRPEHVELAQTVEAAIAPYRRSDKTVDVQLPTFEVYADPVHVRQIVHNLMSNAVRHGGERIIVSARVAGSKATLVIADNGPGISDEVDQVLFERFVHRGRQALIAGSVGLGLAVSRELAMRMGGHLSYTRIGDWSTFTLTLPHVGEMTRPLEDRELVGT